MSFDSTASSQPKRTPWLSATLAVAILGVILAAGDVYFYDKTTRLENEIKALRSSMKSDLAAVQTESQAFTRQSMESFEKLREQLQETGSRSQRALNQASVNAKQYSDQLAQRLADQQKQQVQQQKEQHQVLTSQLGEIRQAHSQTTEKVSGIAGEVNNVKSDVAQAKSELDRTIAELRSVRGDLGVQSGLIATNGRELAALKALGDRDYFEFELPKTKGPQRIGDVAMQLKKADVKRNRFSLELIANDKMVEKKDRSVNEPVQFYLAKARIPYEIVVNEVRKDKIIGYLSAPKIKHMASASRTQ